MPIVTVGMQKGGVGKTTTAGIMAYLLAQKGYRVLAVDFDSQANLTAMLSGIDELDETWEYRTALEATIERKPVSECIMRINDHLDLIPSDDLLATYSRRLYNEFLPRYGRRYEPARLLADTLAPVVDSYDWIIIDTPPALGDLTVAAIVASDWVIGVTEPSRFCLAALPKFLEVVKIGAENVSGAHCRMLGILRTLSDARRNDARMFIELIGERYPQLCFETVILRKAATARLPLYAFATETQSHDTQEAVVQYQPFVEEVLARAGS